MSCSLECLKVPGCDGFSIEVSIVVLFYMFINKRDLIGTEQEQIFYMMFLHILVIVDVT